MNRKETRRLKKEKSKEKNKISTVFKEVPEENWPKHHNKKRIKVFLNRYFLVQIFIEDNEVFRLSINRVERNSEGWKENITWDELQSIKKEIGYGDKYAIEIYPKEADVVNVANMRHLWILPEPLEIGWSKNKKEN